MEPGFGEQLFQESAIQKIEELHQWIDKWQEEEEEDITCKAKIQIMVDGGINKQTSPRVKKAGADILVAGSFLFRHEESIRAGAEES